MTLGPALYEMLIIAIMGLSGISLGLLAGLRSVLLLIPFALAASVAMRVTSALALWSFSLNELSLEVWAALSAATAITAAMRWWRFWRLAFTALAMWVIAGLASIASKYGVGVGEMQHTDSANQFAVSLLVIQSDTPDLSALASSPKLGIAFPLMLALGPGGRIFSAFPFLVFLATASLVLWLSLRVTKPMSRASVYWSLGIIAIFSLTVPMVRIAAFYVNSHTLMGLGVALLTTGVFLAVRSTSARPEHGWLIAVGALLAVTTRIEGIILVAVILLIFASQIQPSTKSRLVLGIGALIAGGGLSWWTGALDSPVIDQFGLHWWWLPILTFVGTVVVTSPPIDRIRRFLPIALVALLVFLLSAEVWKSARPLATATAQVPNLIFGEGGWASAAIAFSVLTLVTAGAHLSRDYRWFLGISWLGIGAILFSKTIDGSFGRESFYDSVNRMVLHIAPLIIVASVVGLTELIERARQRKIEAPSVTATA